MEPISRKTKSTRYAMGSALLMMTAAVIAQAIPAYADNGFLLQLGTFNSQQQASRAADDIAAKNSDILGDLNMRVATVALPPGNSVSFRPQLGTLSSRTQAANLCGKLQSRGVQCTVVETAMRTSDRVATFSSRESSLLPEEQAHANDPDYIPPPVDSGPILISSADENASSTAATAATASASSMASYAPSAGSAAQEQTMAQNSEPQNNEPQNNEPQNTTPQESNPSMAAEQPAPATPAAAPASTASSHDYAVPGRGPRFLDAPTAQAESTAAPEPAPAQQQPERRGFFARLFGFSQPKPADAQGVSGNVNVAEAVRVPLTDSQQAAGRQPLPLLPPVHGLGGYPSDPTTKTLWAQISYFRDENQALTFYRQFSASYPQFSDGVRVRITRPFATALASHVSLRVGPFLGTQDIRTICAAASQWNARCTIVRDIGISTALNSPRRPMASQHAADNRVNRTFAQDTGSQGYWAQLGSFRTSQEAWDNWQEIRSHHRKILSHTHPSVSTPPMSSAANPLYRLRTGPFATYTGAGTLCNRLEAQGTGCIVVSDR